MASNDEQEAMDDLDQLSGGFDWGGAGGTFSDMPARTGSADPSNLINRCTDWTIWEKGEDGWKKV